MRFLCVALLLVVVTLLVPQSEGWRRRRFRRFLRRAKRVVVRAVVGAAVKTAIGRRDVSSLDANNDGLIDQSELEKIVTAEKDVRELLSFVDENGDAAVTAEEMERGLREIAMMDQEADFEANDEITTE